MLSHALIGLNNFIYKRKSLAAKVKGFLMP